MQPKSCRAAVVNQALASTANAPTSTELELLTRYVLGYLTLERTNQLLRSQGRQLRLPARTLPTQA